VNTQQSLQNLFQMGIAMQQRGDVAGAMNIYARVLAADPKHFPALHLSGDIAMRMGDFSQAMEMLGRALAVAPNPQSTGAVYGSRAIAFEMLGQAGEAKADADRAIQLGVSPADLHFDRGSALYGQRRLAEAVANFDACIAADARYIDAYYRRGLALIELNRPDLALDNFTTVVRLAPDFSDAFNGLGLALSELGRHEEGLSAFNTAIRLNPRMASPYINRAIALRELRRFPQALADLDMAVRLDPNSANAHGNRSTLLIDMKRPADAFASLQRALDLNPHFPFLAGLRLHYKMYVCDWSSLDRELDAVLAGVARGEPVSSPAPLLGFSDSPALQRKAAEIWMARHHPANDALGPLPRRPRPARIKLGYYSADFHSHATAHLMAELFERHDRRRFEVVAFSFGPATGDALQKRMMSGSDTFIDVRERNDRDVAALSREMEIDIAVDLKGLTEGYRANIFAHRAAPIQVNYLGYPGTLAAPYYDYIVADGTLITEANRPYFSERIITLPHSYQINDRQRKIAEQTMSRAAAGLPETGFVFCCFNNNFKILPHVFDIWMRILKAVPGSVLWLIEDSDKAAQNLRKEALARGVDAERLVFAGRIAPQDHLARHRLADLFLDTLPYNAHTTASDALWADLPVLTCPGESFAARVAASLLRAVGLPEMVVASLDDYEAAAISLATDPRRLLELKQKLERLRLTAPLFDSELFARDIEAAYTRILDDYYTQMP